MGSCEMNQLEESGGEGKHFIRCLNAKGEEVSEWVQSPEQNQAVSVAAGKNSEAQRGGGSTVPVCTHSAEGLACPPCSCEAQAQT